VANEFVKKHHYSGKVVNNSNLHFGAFLNNILHGVMSFGSPLDKSKVIGLVHTKENKPCLWNEMLELNRMAFDSFLPKNSESRSIAIAIKLLKKNAPHIKWILSFSDGVSCGDGTIYRASGFNLIQINSNTDMWKLLNGEIVSGNTLRQSGYTSWLKPYITVEKFNELRKGKSSSVHVLKYINAEKLKGNQLKYIYIIDKSCHLNTKELPFTEIDKLNAGMYKGKKISVKERKLKSVISIVNDAVTNPSEEGGAVPTITHQ
jgi:hypothetical protein